MATLLPYYLDYPATYPSDGNYPHDSIRPLILVGYLGSKLAPDLASVSGVFIRRGDQNYHLSVTQPEAAKTTQLLFLVTRQPEVHQSFKDLRSGEVIQVWGRFNKAGQWLLVNDLKRQHLYCNSNYNLNHFECSSKFGKSTEEVCPDLKA